MSTAQERLQQGYYNSAAVSGANPGGLASGGHVQNFPAALEDMGVVAQDVGAKAAAGVAAAQSAGQSAAAAHDDRVLAQQAAQAAGQFDPSTKVSKSGDAMTGPLSVGYGGAGQAQLNPGTSEFSGYLSLVLPDGRRIGYIIANQLGEAVLASDNGGKWKVGHLSVDGDLTKAGQAFFYPGNDGSGSGLDADRLRGLISDHNASPSTVAARDGNGSGHFKDVVITLQAYWSNGAWLAVDGDGLKLNRSLYMDSSLSASELRQRSDQRLKDNVESLEASNGRLRPVRYRLKSTNRIMIGFLAQDVERVRPEAVREGEAEDALVAGERPILDLEPMALIAHLAAQVNALQDRLDAAGL